MITPYTANNKCLEVKGSDHMKLVFIIDYKLRVLYIRGVRTCTP